MNEKRNRKKLTGIVIASAMDKTAVVRVTDRVRNQRYQKIVDHTKRFMAHDPKNEASVGDRVEITECRPLSRQKHWKLTQVIEKTPVSREENI